MTMTGDHNQRLHGSLRRAEHASDDKGNQRDLQRQVEQERERLENLVASVPGVVWESHAGPDADALTLDYVSDYAAQMLGYSPDEWLNHPGFWLSIVHPDDRERVAREQAALFADGTEGVLEYRWRAKNGQALWCEAHSVVIRDPQGRPVGMRGVTIDVTARRQAEQARGEAEQMAQATLDGLTAHIAILDKDGNILAVNRAWRQFAQDNGAPPGERFESANYLHVCDSAEGDSCGEANPVADGIRRVIRGEQEVFVLEYPCHSPTEQRWFSARVTRFPGTGTARVVVSHENITERKLGEIALARYAQEMAQTTQTLERANAELNQFAYVTSHDLKAPLRGIANLSLWIEEDLGETIGEDTRQHLELMRGRVHRMEAMIEGILQYSRVGRESVRLETVDVGKLLAEIVDLLAPPSHIHTEIMPPMPALTCERIRLEQVLMNLIGNAVKYHHPAGGHVRVSCRLLPPDENTNAVFYEFSVTDDGPGIAAQYHDKIFQIFQTLQARDKVESTGIGLSLVRKIVESQGGRVWIESQEGWGATFRFTWPQIPANTASSP